MPCCVSEDGKKSLKLTISAPHRVPSRASVLVPSTEGSHVHNGGSKLPGKDVKVSGGAKIRENRRGEEANEAKPNHTLPSAHEKVPDH